MKWVKKIKYIKLDADDIMEIVLHYYQEKFDHSEHARGNSTRDS